MASNVVYVSAPAPVGAALVYPYMLAQAGALSRLNTPGRFSQWSGTLDFPADARTLPVLPFQPPFVAGAPRAPVYVGF